MSVANVRVVRVLVHDRRMDVPMRVRLGRVRSGLVVVLMMLVVGVGMVMSSTEQELRKGRADAEERGCAQREEHRTVDSRRGRGAHAGSTAARVTGLRRNRDANAPALEPTEESDEPDRRAQVEVELPQPRGGDTAHERERMFDMMSAAWTLPRGQPGIRRLGASGPLLKVLGQ